MPIMMLFDICSDQHDDEVPIFTESFSILYLKEMIIITEASTIYHFLMEKEK